MIRRLFIMLIFPLQLFSQVYLPSGTNEVELVGHPEVYSLYTEKNITVDEVRQFDFTKNYSIDDIPQKDKSLWIKFELVTNPLKDSLVYFYSEADYYTIYKKNAVGWDSLQNGFLMPIQKRSSKKSEKILAFINEADHVSDYYIKIETGGYDDPTTYPIVGGESFYFKKSEELNDFSRLNVILSVIYITGLLVVFIFILMQFITLGEEVYKYYLLYLVSQLLFGFVVLVKTPIRFLNFGLFYPKIFYIFNESSQFLFIGVYSIFIIKLFEFKKEEAIHKFMMWFAYACFVYAAFSLVFLSLGPGYELRYFVFNIVRIIIVPLNVFLIFWVILKVKKPLINYFMVAHMFFFAGTMISVYAQMWHLDKDPSSIFYFDNSLNVIFEMGLLGEAVCFSLALALRIKFLQEDREKSTLAYISQLKENELIKERMNRELDVKIKEKSEELVEIYSEMERQREREITLEFSRKIQEMEINALRNQMNPHFLFNSMNAIKHLILTNRFDEGISYLDDFSGLLRNVLQTSKRQTVTVEEELEILELYLSLEKARMQDDLTIDIFVENKDVLSQYTIPGLLLQPFVENAIWHGLRPSVKKEKILTVKFELKPNLVISIQDNGIGRKASEIQKGDVVSMHESMGMKIAENRLNLFNQTHNFQIDFDIVDLKNKSGRPDGTLVVLNYSI